MYRSIPLITLMTKYLLCSCIWLVSYDCIPACKDEGSGLWPIPAQTLMSLHSFLDQEWACGLKTGVIHPSPWGRMVSDTFPSKSLQDLFSSFHSCRFFVFLPAFPLLMCVTLQLRPLPVKRAHVLPRYVRDASTHVPSFRFGKELSATNRLQGRLPVPSPITAGSSLSNFSSGLSLADCGRVFLCVFVLCSLFQCAPFIYIL